MKILIDMNLSPRWAQALRDAGFEAEHWSRLGRANAADVELFSFAVQGAWTILTHDLDFGAMLAASQGAGPSVVQLRVDDLRPEAVAEFLIAGLRQAEMDLNGGALVTIGPAKGRLRILPLGSMMR